MKKIIVMLLAFTLLGCGTIQYVTVKMPYLPEFSCPPIVKPDLKIADEVTMSKAELLLVDEYNLQAAIRYRKSLTHYIVCVRNNLKKIREEALRIQKKLEEETK